MPTHVYKPQRTPPTWLDRLLVHPFDMTAAALAVLFGLLVLGSLFVPGFVPSKSMDQMPDIIIIAVSGFLGTGGLLALIGLNWLGDVVSHGWALERLGWFLAAGGFATYSITVFSHYPASVFSWTIPFALGIGSIIRVWSVRRIEKGTRKTLAEVKGRINE